MELSGRVALVTGASSGIGEATAKALADEGVRVGLAARREAKLEAVADDIEADGGEAVVVPTDIRDEAQVTAMVETVQEALGPIDILVNNAGTGHEKPFTDTNHDEIRRDVETNLLGAMYATRAVLPEMLAAGGGHVVAVSSLNGRHPTENASVYTATKFGLNGFCRALRKEVADDGIHVSIIMPGPVVTELKDWEAWDGRALAPADIAETIVFAVSRPDYVSVSDLTVNSVDKHI